MIILTLIGGSWGLSLTGLINDFEKKENFFTGNHKHKKNESINFVKSSHPLWVTLFIILRSSAY